MIASDNTRDPFHAYGDLDMLEFCAKAWRILHLGLRLRGLGACRRRVTPRALARFRCDRTGRQRRFHADRALRLHGTAVRPHSDRVVVREAARFSPSRRATPP